MKIEIWSDVACPFCYMGKRNLELALSQFEHRSNVKIEWKSFQLNPEIVGTVQGDIHDYLAARYGRSREWAKEMNEDVAARARKVGLEYDFDSLVPANTFDAHRLVHLAAEKGLQESAEERLFAAYFTEGKNIADAGTLAGLGSAIGIEPQEISSMLEGDRYADEVRSDMEEAESLGINAVPFFVFDRKYAISGAQPVHLFLETLMKVHEEVKDGIENQPDKP